MSNTHRPLLGEPDKPCRTCGAPLAADQRYCLQCGTRRAEARLPFLDILAQQVPQGAAATASTTTATTTTRGHGLLGRMSANAAAIAGVACLVLALGVGVLIGGLGSDDAPASSPPIITVGGAAPAAAAAAPGASTATPAVTETAPATTTTPEDKGDTSSKDASGSSSSSGSKATNNAVKDLDKASGSDYSKKSAKLPKQVGTGGAAPPIDPAEKSKPAGGGSDLEEIG